MTAFSCGRCGSSREIQDNFCRSCGHQFTVNLPAVRMPALPARAVTLPPSMVGSIAVLALGTGLEWLARRFAANAARAAERALTNRDSRPTEVRPRQPIAPEKHGDVTVDELLYVRKIQVRR